MELIHGEGPDLNAQPCPRCGEHSMYDPLPINALSRTTRGTDDEPVWVCSDCGTDEGFMDLWDGGATPQSEWPVPERTYEGLITGAGQRFRKVRW
jgi:hypothetical protein